MLPLWSSYLVKVYAWKLILAKEGILDLGCRSASARRRSWTRSCRCPVIGGNSLSVSYIGTFIVFVYVWLPFMILPMQAALERVPGNLLEASADLGATPGQTFRNVILPLALPGLVAGSIFTFSLTLGDYIIPQIVGTRACSSARRSTRSRARPGTSRSPPPSRSCRSSSWASTSGWPSGMGAFDAL